MGVSGVAKQLKDRENAPVVRSAVRKVELGEDRVDVFLNGALGDEEFLAHGGVGVPLSHERQHFAFTFGETRDR